MTVDEQIANIDANIRKNLASAGPDDRGFLSQNILSQLRNLVEACMVRLMNDDGSIVFNYNLVKNAKKWVASQGDYKFLSDFHERLQVSGSHYTLGEDESERLMLRYLEYLYKARSVAKQVFKMDILATLEDYPVNQALQAPYREAIARVIESKRMTVSSRLDPERYYVWRSTPFFVSGRVYYEVTLTPARDRLSNTDHLVVYTYHAVLKNHAIRAALDNSHITVDGFKIPITVMFDWCVAIRPCELKWLARILGIEDYETTAIDRGYQALMGALFQRMSSMLDVARLSQTYYEGLRSELLRNRAEQEVALLDKLRETIRSGKPGANIVAYLAYGMRNGVLKRQYDQRPNGKLSNLHLQNGCICFDEMPLCTHPCGHAARLSDVLACIDCRGREHELLDAWLIASIEHDGAMFTPVKELPFADSEKLRLEFNNHVYVGHREFRTIDCHNKHFFIKSYVDDAIRVLKILVDRAKCGVPGYAQHANAVLSDMGVDGAYSEEKINLLRRLFTDSKVAAVYGSAGTGKSTFISLVSLTTSGSKLFLAHTHSAVENLKRRVGKDSGEFATVESYIMQQGTGEYSLVVVDECSTVPNEKIRKVLERTQAKRLLLVGDDCQIGSIRFGNWFEMCRRCLPDEAQFDLVETFRTDSEVLLALWDKVRNRDARLDEFITKQGFVSRLGPGVFDRASEDEVVLCLSYNGLYGVNNINRVLQQSNPEESIEWQHRTYKIGDPIVFGDTRRFLSVIHNNSKGIIRKIDKSDEQIRFDIEIQSFFTSAEGADLLFLGNPSSETSLVRINVFLGNDDADEDMGTELSKTVMPFQIAYAMSIHKAQGLEYDSVKLVIPSEVDSLITHGIFYTGITRAKRHLKIFWEPESQVRVLKSFDGKSSRACVLKRELDFLKQIAEKRGIAL